MGGEFDQIPEIALRWHDEGRGAVLATVVQTWGSAPRQAGSQMAISGRGELMGSVSGGCVEGAVVTEAQEALVQGRPQLLRFGVADETAFEVGLACGGTIEVLIEPIGESATAFAPDLLRALVKARAAREPIACVTEFESWKRNLLGPDNPPLRLVVVGAVHIAQALLPMARLAGFAPILVDPREAFASALRFPDETLMYDWPDDALAKLAPDARTAVVTLTHDPKLDDPAIIAALQTEVFYLGCLGSTRTHSKRLDRLRAAGLGDEQLSRIHAPVGLSLGARTPAEIAVATLAQVIQTLRVAR